MARLWFALLAIVTPAACRKFHDANKHKHEHTFLHFCVHNAAATVTPFACVQGTPKKWPAAAQNYEACGGGAGPTGGAVTHKTAEAPHLDQMNAGFPSSAGDCKPTVGAGGGATWPAGTNHFYPVVASTQLVGGTIAEGLSVEKRHETGADVDTWQQWDRLRCVDGQILSTAWHTRYTPQECARVCSKINNFREGGYSHRQQGFSCTHFSRQWIQTNIEEHLDNCGRDGDSGPDAGASPKCATDGAAYTSCTDKTYGAAGYGTGSYKFKGQCIFFNSINRDCCATRAHFEIDNDAAKTANTHCTTKHGVGGRPPKTDNWNSKHRTWRKVPDMSTYVHAGASWPTMGLESYYNGRRLSDANSSLHEFILPNGTRFWSEE